MSAVARARTPMPELDDAALVERFLAGDRAAYATLYHRHAERVFARLTRLVGPGPDREDLLQQVFLALYRALPGFRGDAALTTYLHRITVNVACDHLRRRGRRAVAYEPAALDELIDGSPTPEARARLRAELQQLLVLLERIKPAKRIAFVLVAVEGLSLAEVAALVEARPEAVKQRVLHARRELLAMLARADRRAGGGER
jgi:RNA polymerase sigma-70 factor (ECF subfamily)